MPKNTQLTDLAVNTEADAMGALLDGGFVDVMDGKQAETADTPIESQRALVTLGLGKPAFRKSVVGVLVSNGLTPGVAVADGTPTWFRTYRADHKTAVFDGSAGKGAGYNMELPAKTIAEGITVGCSGITHSVVKSMAGI